MADLASVTQAMVAGDRVSAVRLTHAAVDEGLPPRRPSSTP